MEDAPGVLEMGFESREDCILKGIRIIIDEKRRMEIAFKAASELRRGDYYVFRIPGLRLEPGSYRLEVALLKAEGEERLQAMEVTI